MAALLQDLQGECTLAFANAKDARRWGRHYVKSLSFAHGAQQCNNFKDPGVQAYGGRMFTAVRDAADDTFLRLPAPEPSRRKQLEQAWMAEARNASKPFVPLQPVSMATYYNYGGGCTAEGCRATLGDGVSTRRGGPAPRRRGGDGGVQADGTTPATAVVRCVVATAVRTGAVEMAHQRQWRQLLLAVPQRRGRRPYRGCALHSHVHLRA